MLLYRNMQYLQKKKKKDDYNLKINVPKVTMLCKWPLIYVWILAVPLFYSLEYWLLGLEIPHRDLPLQEFFIWDFSPFSNERHQQLAVVHHHSLNQIRKTEFSLFPPHFAKFNLPQHRLALRSNKREAKGRSALKATLEGGGLKRKKKKKKEAMLTQAFSGPRRV